MRIIAVEEHFWSRDFAAHFTGPSAERSPDLMRRLDDFSELSLGDMDAAGGRAFEEVAGDQLMHFQFSDLSPNPVTGVKRPTDRLMPGKGVSQWNETFTLLHESGHTGLLSFEAPNPEQWERPPVDVCREGVELMPAAP